MQSPRASGPAQRFVLLQGTAPVSAITLVKADDEEDRLRFSALPEAACPSYSFGLQPLGERHASRIRAVQVYRGRSGGKAPVSLYLLQAVAPDYITWPKVRRSGFAKALLRHSRDLAGEALPSLSQAWLSVEFALHGLAAASEYEALAGTAADELSKKGAPRQVGSYLLAADAVQRWTQTLAERSKRARRSNPFWTLPSIEQVLEFCALPDPTVAELVLADYLKQQSQASSAENKQSTALPTADKLAADDILKQVNAPEPVLLNELRAKHPSRLHLLAWLIEAGVLIESPYGLLFSREQIARWTRQLRGKLLPGEPVPTGLLRTELGIPRRKAEALRDVLTLRPWLIPAPPKTKPARRTTAAGKGRPSAKRPSQSQRKGGSDA